MTEKAIVHIQNQLMIKDPRLCCVVIGHTVAASSSYIDYIIKNWGLDKVRYIPETTRMLGMHVLRIFLVGEYFKNPAWYDMLTYCAGPLHFIYLPSVLAAYNIEADPHKIKVPMIDVIPELSKAQEYFRGFYYRKGAIVDKM